MRPLIDRSELLFGLVKGATLAVAWAVMANYAKVNRRFVRDACLVGSVAYVLIWVSWVLHAN